MIQEGNDHDRLQDGVSTRGPSLVPKVLSPTEDARPAAVERRRVVALRTDANDQNRVMMTAARLVHSTNRVRNFAAVLLALLGCSVIGLAFLPWQQSARGTGRVVAYKPGERQQEITSPQKGVVASVPDTLVEGASVREGDLLLEIRPFAANLEMQLEGQLGNLRTKLETAKIKAEAYAQNVIAYESARDSAVEAAERGIEAAEADLARANNMFKSNRVSSLNWSDTEFQNGTALWDVFFDFQNLADEAFKDHVKIRSERKLKQDDYLGLSFRTVSNPFYIGRPEILKALFPCSGWN